MQLFFFSNRNRRFVLQLENQGLQIVLVRALYMGTFTIGYDKTELLTESTPYLWALILSNKFNDTHLFLNIQQLDAQQRGNRVSQRQQTFSFLTSDEIGCGDLYPKYKIYGFTRKYPLCGYILGVLTHKTAWD